MGPKTRGRLEPDMTIPHSVSDVLESHVVLESESIDRMYLNVYVPAPASFPIRSPTSAGRASCRSALEPRASPTSATRRTPTTHRAPSAVVASIRSSACPSVSGSRHGMSKWCANPSAWYRSAASISTRAFRRRKRRASRGPKAMATAAASTRRTST